MFEPDPRRYVLTLLCVTFLLLASAAPATAQGDTGQISGTVKDAQGGVLPGATVTLRNQATASPAPSSPRLTARSAFRRSIPAASR